MIQPPNKGGKRHDKLLKIESTDSKLVSYTKNNGGGKMCMGLPQPYWSSYYKEVDSDNSDPTQPIDTPLDSQLIAMSCGDSTHFGTNFKSYSDSSIRLSNNNKYCVTHKPLENGRTNNNIDDPNNFVFLEECNENLVNQQFLIQNNNLQVFGASNRGDGETCITHTPENKLRLETCGDQKYTALYLKDDKIFRQDKCFKDEAIDVLREVSAIESCVDRTYFVIYMDGVMKYNEFCSKNEADSYYKKVNKLYPGGVVIAHKEKIIKQSFDDDIPSNFENKILNLITKKGKCVDCKNPSRMLCSRQRMKETVLNSFNNFKEEQRLTEYCIKMKDTDDFRCGRANRQKFVNFPLPEDYCVNVGKEIWVELPSAELKNGASADLSVTYFNRAPSDTTVTSQFPVQNLLGEVYNTNNYTVFLSAKIVESTSTKYTIRFNIPSSNIPLLTDALLKIDRLSDYFCLNYKPPPYMIKLGTKVLVKFKQFNTGSVLIPKDDIRYLGVVVKKISPIQFKVMLSINSYEPNKKNELKVGSLYYTSNPVITVNIEDIVVYKKANKCLTN